MTNTPQAGEGRERICTALTPYRPGVADAWVHPDLRNEDGVLRCIHCDLGLPAPHENTAGAGEGEPIWISHIRNELEARVSPSITLSTAEVRDLLTKPDEAQKKIENAKKRLRERFSAKVFDDRKILDLQSQLQAAKEREEECWRAINKAGVFNPNGKMSIPDAVDFMAARIERQEKIICDQALELSEGDSEDYPGETPQPKAEG